MTDDDRSNDAWLTEPAVTALSEAVAALVPTGSVALLGAAADRWADILGSRAEVLQGPGAPARTTKADPSKFVLAAVVAPDGLPDSVDGEAAFVSELVALADVVLLATINPAGASPVHGRWPAYWAARFAEHGWSFPDLVRPAIWDDTQLAPDVKEGALLFAAPSVVLPGRSPGLQFPSGSSAVLHPQRLAVLQRVYQASLGAHVQAAAASQAELEARLQADVDQLKAEALTHRIRLGALEARLAAGERRWAEAVSSAAHPPAKVTPRTFARRLLGRDVAGTTRSADPAMMDLFDTVYYVRQNPEAQQEPWRHYLETGEAQGRRPNAYFDPEFYRMQNPDVAESGMGLLEHYSRYGGFEGRAASEQFNTDWYVSNHPEVAVSGLHPLLHFLLLGRTAGYAATRD